MKIEEQVLSREQMAHLEQLGIDVTDASMAYYDISRDGESEKWILGIANPLVIEKLVVNCGIKQIAHTYTIGDLIEKLPKSENIGDLLIEFCNSDLGYGDWDCSELYGINGQQNFKDKPLKDALYNLLCWVVENHKELIK